MHDTSQKPGQPDPGYTQADWDEVSDNAEMTRAELAEMRPASEVPEVFNLLPKRGRPKLPNAKVNVTVRIDPQILEAYRATGEGWQVRMGEVLAAGLVSSGKVRRAQHFVGSGIVREGKGTKLVGHYHAAGSGQLAAARGSGAPRKPKAKA